MRHTGVLLGAALAVLALVTPAAGQTAAPRGGKPGGVLRLLLREDLPQGFSLHETATNSVTWKIEMLTDLGVDDPDANFYENYACGSSRNYGDYCDEQVMKLIEQQSQETDFQKRLALVRRIQPHNVTYNWPRLQEIRLDR